MTPLSCPRSSAFARSGRAQFTALFVVALAVLLVIALMPAAAQTNSRITSVDPTSGKVNDTVTAAGDSLAKSVVSGVFLSDDQNDHKATIVDQESGKIVFKVPQ